MLRIEYTRYGGPEVMQLVEYRQSAPAARELVVRVKAASVNPIDLKIRNGELKVITGRKFPRGMGRDFAGVVEAVGSSITRFKSGDEVFGGIELKDSATFAETVLVSEGLAALKPANISFPQAGALTTVAKTAWGAVVDVGQLRLGQRLLVNGCLGGVGRCAVEIGKAFGAEVSGTCSVSDLESASRLGVFPAVDYRYFQPAQFRHRFDLVLDTFGNLSTAQCSTMLRPKGRALHLSGSFGKILRILVAPRNKFVGSKMTPELLAKVGAAAASGSLTVPVAGTVPLEEAISAIRSLERTGVPRGKLVIVPGPLASASLEGCR